MIFSALVFALLEIVIIILLVLVGERLFSALGDVGQMLCYIVLLALPVAITRFPIKLIDKTWSGEVTKVDVQTVSAFTNEGKPRRYTQNEVYLTVQRTDGRIVSHKVEVFGAKTDRAAAIAMDSYTAVKPEHFLDKYKVGCTVYHFYGIKRLFIINPEQKDITMCIVCGRENRADADVCWDCGYSLIKDTDK